MEFRLLAPTGCPLELKEIALVSYRAFSSDCQEEFVSAVKKYLGVKHCFPVSSGKEALYFILRALSRINAGKEVLIPAYTCYSVPSAIVRAGLKIRLCDVDPVTLDFDYDRLKGIPFENVLAVVPSNLFGFVNNLAEISAIAHEAGAFVIDDAAQSFGGLVNGKFSGTLGDAGLFSLGRGKNITTLGGGIIVTDSDKIAEEIKADWPDLSSDKPFDMVYFIIKSILYSLLLRPNLYWLPARLPFLGLGKTIYDPDFPLEGFSNSKAALGSIMLKKINKVNNDRKKNANLLREKLLPAENIFLPESFEGVEPLYLRFPVILKERETREKVLDELARKGINASPMYPDTINHISGIKKHLAEDGEFPGARRLADTLLTMPTHAHVKCEDISVIAEVLSGCSETPT